ncbi:MAG: hypothetical protein PF636_11530, partial [Actinomycetota bacterium]|nr:hypothetical protein [Actinomycetota bacterium]
MALPYKKQNKVTSNPLSKSVYQPRNPTGVQTDRQALLDRDVAISGPADYRYKQSNIGGTAITPTTRQAPAYNPNYETAGIGDMGFDAIRTALEAQSKEGIANRIDQTKEGEITRGMLRSGVALGKEDDVRRTGAQDLAQAIAAKYLQESQARIGQQDAVAG